MKRDSLLILIGLGIGAYALFAGRKKNGAGERAPDVVEEVNLEETEMPVPMPVTPPVGDPDAPYIPPII